MRNAARLSHAILWALIYIVPILILNYFYQEHRPTDPNGVEKFFHESFLVLASIALLPAGGLFMAGWNNYGRASFKRVFGKKILTSEYCISVPEFRLSEQAQKVLEDNGLDNSRKRFAPLGVEAAKYKAGDIQKIIASSDIIGAGYVMDSLGRYTDKGPKFQFGDDLCKGADSFLSFGLQTNIHTPFFVGLAGKAKARKVLKRAVVNERFPSVARRLANIKNFERLEMEPVRDGRSADLLFYADNDVIRVSQDHQHSWNIGILTISRVRTPKHKELDLRRICCAGVGHGGTSGSSYYLAHHWQAYEKHFGRLSNYDAVLAVTLTEMKAGSDADSFQNQKIADDPGTIELLKVGLRINDG